MNENVIKKPSAVIESIAKSSRTLTFSLAPVPYLILSPEILDQVVLEVCHQDNTKILFLLVFLLMLFNKVARL